jgi:hypothetical protein
MSTNDTTHDAKTPLQEGGILESNPQEPAIPEKPEPGPPSGSMAEAAFSGTPEEIPPTPPGEQKRGSPGGPGGSGRFKLFLIALAVICIVALIGIYTLNVQITFSNPRATYPYTTTYDVHFPLGKPVSIGNTRMIALTAGDEMIIQVDQNPGEKILVNEERKISERKAIISLYGVPMLQTNFQIYLRYLGLDENKARFYLTVKRSDDIPQFIIDRLLPAEIDAVPA